MTHDLRLPSRLSHLVALLMTTQAALGRSFAEQYRDVEWVRATWVGNDFVTLLVAVPILIAGQAFARRGSARAGLLWVGVLGYSAYNYAYYLLGAALNVFFPLYVVLFVFSVVALVLLVTRLDVARTATIGGAAPVRTIGAFFVIVAVGLSSVWFGVWAAHVFAGRPTPIEPAAFRLVAALDTSLMVPLMAIGGALLWRRSGWGVVITGIAGVQGSLYLLVLAVNAVIAIAGGRVEAPGELPVWGGLAAATTVATVVLLSSVRSPHARTGGAQES